MPDDEVELISEAVDGMSFEMTFHRLARGDRQRTTHLITVYRKWLAAGKVIVFIPVDPGLEVPASKDEEARLIAAFAMVIRDPGDRLFVAWPFYKVEADWAYWPEQLGKATGQWQFEADHVLTRRFERGLLWLDVISRKVQIKP